MAINENEDLETETDEAGDGNAAKVLRKQNKQLAADLAAATSKLADLDKKARAATISDVLRDNGGKPGWARYAASDIEGDVTPEAVLAWLEKEGPDLGWEAPETDDDETVENQKQAERVSRATSGAPAGNVAWTVERIKNASDAELIAAGYMNKR